MEHVIDNLRKENRQLKSASERKKGVIRKRNEPQMIINTGYERDEQSEDSEELKQQCRLLKRELAEIKEECVNLRHSRQEKASSTLGVSGVTESKQDKVSFFLRKIAEYSREMVSDKESPLEYEIYSTIVTKFMRQIESLEKERTILKD
jgi:hypothetical protein